MLDPTLVTTRPFTVGESGRPRRWPDIADRRGHWGRPHNLDVAVSADVPAFLDRFIERVGELAAPLGPARHARHHPTARTSGGGQEEPGVSQFVVRCGGIAAFVVIAVIGIAGLLSFAPDRANDSWALVAVTSLAAAIMMYGFVEYAQTGQVESISRQFDTRTIVLIPIAIAINIVLGQAVSAALKVRSISTPSAPSSWWHPGRTHPGRHHWAAGQPPVDVRRAATIPEPVRGPVLGRGRGHQAHGGRIRVTSAGCDRGPVARDGS
ncbi:MAG: hypothetical protein R3C32_12930 [Chloroflexota bacterium]